MVIFLYNLYNFIGYNNLNKALSLYPSNIVMQIVVYIIDK